jgi:arabinogalactan endo-1,4-beta-galactosidase
MHDNSKQLVDVEWFNVDVDAMKNNGPAKYTIYGKAGGMDAVCYVSMVEYNYVQNWSFEDDLTGSGWTTSFPKKLSELKVIDKVGDSQTGTRHYHFWNNEAVEFNLEQEITGLGNGKYKFCMSTMGGDMGDYTAYFYVKINGEIVSRKDATFTAWDEWHTTDFIEFNCTEGDTVVVGIYVKAASGAWGSIDDAMLNSVKE